MKGIKLEENDDDDDDEDDGMVQVNETNKGTQQ